MYYRLSGGIATLNPRLHIDYSPVGEITATHATACVSPAATRPTPLTTDNCHCPGRGKITLTAGSAGGAPVAPSHPPYSQPRSGLHNLPMALCNPFRVAAADWRTFTTGMPPALPAANDIFPLRGKIPWRPASVDDSLSGNINKSPSFRGYHYAQPPANHGLFPCRGKSRRHMPLRVPPL